MPQGESYWNPYRWVPVSTADVPRAIPNYRHRWEGLSGRIKCTVEALTPLLVGSSKGDGQFIRCHRFGPPFLPGTSLKGVIRSLAELLSNSAIPFPNAPVDRTHTLAQGAQGAGIHWQLDTAARMFGYLHRGDVFAGLVRISDGRLVGPEPKPLAFKVAGGAPHPDHKPFYPSDRASRKFYHHHPDASTLVPPHPGINDGQKRTVYPLPPGVQFEFDVMFENLRDDELGLLLYCLVLEEQVSVTLSPAALGPTATVPVTLTGPLRHKLGGCKPQGAGSVRIRIDQLALLNSVADRYRGRADGSRTLEDEELKTELVQRLRPLMGRSDPTMLHLRAMLIYCDEDPRRPMDYPDHAWFLRDKGTGMPLKPTL